MESGCDTGPPPPLALFAIVQFCGRTFVLHRPSLGAAAALLTSDEAYGSLAERGPSPVHSFYNVCFPCGTMHTGAASFLRRIRDPSAHFAVRLRQPGHR